MNVSPLSQPVRAYPRYEDHQSAWEELAAGIASLKHRIAQPEAAEPAAVQGELVIIGSGIETIGFSVGDQALIETADKVLYCIADPATIVWLQRLRPDALDLYVLYGDDKIRYTTYMQMAEAQLYWVRQGLKVVVIFYGHPGVFVLSTHRAVLIARREGHKALMKAGISALDTLCADLGVDPSHPGLQTHEATDCLTRRRRIDTSLHVVLWQVGLIGELGYRRHGYLNSNFSYFVAWLQHIYGPDYPVTHYIGSRYPSIDPLIKTYALSQLHDPEIQQIITGLSTFYVAPRDVVPTDPQTAKDLGLVQEGQKLVTPTSPLRRIGDYGPREMEAFKAFERFSIPPSYRWQADTEASNFLVELRFDTELQDLYRRDPLQALEDPRFKRLSDRERSLLASRDAGAIQIAAKGAYRRSPGNEALVGGVLNSKAQCQTLLGLVDGKSRAAAREALFRWAEKEALRLDWSLVRGSIDYVYRNNLYPWTGVYVAEDEESVVTIIGNQVSRSRSLIYVNDVQIRRFQFLDGVVKWKAGQGEAFNGYLKLDLDPSGQRRLLGKTWTAGQAPAEASSFIASEADPGRRTVWPGLASLLRQGPGLFHGRYVIRTNGRFAQEAVPLVLDQAGLTIDGAPAAAFHQEGAALSWRGGVKDCTEGEVTFLVDPITGSVELFGRTVSAQDRQVLKCHGARLGEGLAGCVPPPIKPWAHAHLAQLVADHQQKGGLMLWHKWEKFNFTNAVVSKYLAPIV